MHLVAAVFKCSLLIADLVQRYLRLEVRLVLRRRSYATALRPVRAFDSRSIATRGAVPGLLTPRLRRANPVVVYRSAAHLALTHHASMLD